MGDFTDIFSFLNFLGLTPDRLIPLIFLTLALYVIFQKKLYKHLNPIKNAIVEIQTIFRQNDISICHSLTETRSSPLKPTEYGLNLIDASGLGKIMKDNQEKLLKELDELLKKNPPITAYDVQERARELMISYINKPLMAEVKLYAFKEGISVESILRPAGLILRDKYLDEHSKIKK